MIKFEGRTLVRRRQFRRLSPGEAGFLPQTATFADEVCATILLCAFIGVRFLKARLASLDRQTHRIWRLLVSDDGSSDATSTILEQFAGRVVQSVEVRSGSRRRGPTVNFLALAAHDEQLKDDHFASCNQGDVWHPDKLRKAVVQRSHLQRISVNLPPDFILLRVGAVCHCRMLLP